MNKFLRKIIKEELDDSMDWIKQHDFHLDLMSQNKRNIQSLSEVKKILFNPAVQTSSKKFKNIFPGSDIILINLLGQTS